MPPFAFPLRRACALTLVAGAAAAAAASAQPPDISGAHNFVRISDRLATSGQITNEEIAAVDAAGFEVLVNLAPARRERNFEEGYRAVEAGLTYVQIPVDWREPSLRDLELFFDVMDANADRRVFVHCFANMRVSVFTYLYRTLREGVPEAEAWADVLRVWDPGADPETAQWPRFIAAAQERFSGR